MARLITSTMEEKVRREWMERVGLDPEQDEWIWDKAKQISSEIIYAEQAPAIFVTFCTMTCAAAYVAAGSGMSPKMFREYFEDNLASIFAMANWEIEREIRQEDQEIQESEITH